MVSSKTSLPPVLEALRDLARYAAGRARLEGLLPEAIPEFEERIATMAVESMSKQREQQLVECAGLFDKEFDGRIHQARVANVAAHTIEFIRDLAEERAKAKKDVGAEVPEFVSAVAEAFRTTCRSWSIPIMRGELVEDEVSDKQLDEPMKGLLEKRRNEHARELATKLVTEFFAPSADNAQAAVARVVAEAAYPDDRMSSARTLNGVFSALSGKPQSQGRFQTPGAVRDALFAEVSQRDVALWAMSVAFPGAPVEHLSDMVNAARAVLDPRLQPTSSSLQPEADSPVLPNSGDANHRTSTS